MGSMGPPGPRGDPTGGLNGQDSFGLEKLSGQSSLGQLSRPSSLGKASGQSGNNGLGALSGIVEERQD